MSRGGTSRRHLGGLLAFAVVLGAACSSGGDEAPAARADEQASPATTAGAGESDGADDEWSGLPGADGVTGNDAGVDPLPPLPDDVALPIVFVHGFAGSAQQYESQAMRFVANGYPQDRILAYEHDGAGMDVDGYTDGLDAFVDAALDQFDVEQVYLVGHSRGTFVSSTYLSDPARATKVVKYVALDGAPCPTAVPCVAPTQATNPGQSHVEVATSKESFTAQYEFLVGAVPEVVDITPQRDPVVISGRAVNFPANTGRAGTTLDIWDVNPASGARVGDEPHASFELGDDGAFGPLVVESGARYEYVLSSPETDTQHHLYLQPYVRDSDLVRLLSSEPDSATRTNTNLGDGHAAVIAIRMREWYADDDPDRDGDERDVVQISTRSEAGDQEPVNAIVPFVGNGAIAVHLHDDAATPGESTLGPLPYFASQPFQAGVDVYMPAALIPDGTIRVTNFPRGDADAPQTISVPNWASSKHTISVVFTDYPVD